MTIQHKLITDPDIHEPKGAAAAGARKVYVADGAGSGNWEYVKPEGTTTALAGEVYVADGAGSGSMEYPAGKLHAEIYITGGTTAQTLSSGSAYARLDPGTAWQQGETNVLTTTPSDGTITLTKAGTYFISFWVNLVTAAIAQGASYNFKYAINGTVGTRKFHVHKISNGADSLMASATGLVTVAANDVLSIHVGGDATSSGTTITVDEAGLQAILLTE